MQRYWTKQIWVTLLTLAAIFLTPQTFAHAKAVSADPAPRSVISHSPQSINILLNQQFEPSYSTIVIKGSDGKPVTAAKATVDPDNKKRLTLSLPTLPSGKYTVSYKILSLDGHTIASSYTFKIKKEKPPAN